MRMIIHAVSIVAFFCFAYGHSSPCVQTVNSYGYSLDHIIDKVIRDADVNLDGHIDVEEARKEILEKWVVNGTTVAKEDFVAQFVIQYWDDYALTSQFFDNIDVNHDGMLTEVDYFTILMRWLGPDLIGDRVPIANIRQFIHEKHPEGCKVTATPTVPTVLG